MSHNGSGDDVLSCPFCEFEDHDSDFLSQHVAFYHPEDPVIHHGEGNLLLQNGDVDDDDDDAEYSAALVENTGLYVPCPHGCGESVARAELQLHLDLHVAESVALDESGASPHHDQGVTQPRGLGDIHDENLYLHQDEDLAAHSTDIVLEGKTAGGSRRRHKKDGTRPGQHAKKGIRKLGRAELGPYAHEKQMPSWLRKLLQTGSIENIQTKIGPNGSLVRDNVTENETSRVIPALIELCRHDTSVQRAFFCSPRVRHIFKFMREGGFCGYRNIQMLISHIIDARKPGHEHFSARIPSILDLQNMIEQAWDMGFNSSGRIETGGIKGTRKYIGTPEAQALFLSLGIRCTADAFSSDNGFRAHDMLLQDIASYFRSACSSTLLDSNEKILETDLPPVYLQHQGHSLTIVGFEISSSGSANLLVFDPMFRTSPAIQRLVGKFVKPSDPSRVLKVWRRGTPYLQKHKEFEVLKLI